MATYNFERMLKKSTITLNSGRFELIRKIGSGSFGDIFFALEHETSKVLPNHPDLQGITTVIQ